MLRKGCAGKAAGEGTGGCRVVRTGLGELCSPWPSAQNGLFHGETFSSSIHDTSVTACM